MRLFPRLVSRSVLVCAASVCTAANAATINLDFTHSGSGVAQGGNGYGNALTFSNSGLSVTARGYGLTDNQGGLFFPDYRLEAAELSQWSTGIGLCDQAEGSIQAGSCHTGSLLGGGQHQIDSAGSNNYLMLTFSQEVSMTSATIDPYGHHDRDVRFWVGSVDTGTFSLAGADESGISGLIGSSAVDKSAHSGSGPLTVGLDNLSGNVLVLGALGDQGLFDAEDYFKFSGMTVEAEVIPVPAAAWLFGSALLGLFGLRRRRG